MFIKDSETKLGCRKNYIITLLNCKRCKLDFDESIDYENYIKIHRLNYTSVMFYIRIEKKYKFRQVSKKVQAQKNTEFKRSWVAKRIIKLNFSIATNVKLT